MNNNGAGVGICSCGGQLVVACSKGCPEPDVVFRADTRAPKPRDRHRHGIRRKAKDVPPGICNYQSGNCQEPVAPYTYNGRPTTKCEKHLAMVRKWEANRRRREIKVAAVGPR